jgi:TatD DNase family protein
MPSSEPNALWDAHVHLPAYPDPEAVVSSAARRGMRLALVCVAPAEAAPSLDLRTRHPNILKCFVGVHPSEAASSPRALEELSPFWDAADGVGEVGLDPKYSEVSASSAQMRLFRGQVEVAARTKKPIQVHSRGAEAACIDVLDGYPMGPVLMHWFEGEEVIGRVLSRARTYVSFGPALLYSKKLQRVALRCPPETVLVESDGPVTFAALGGPQGPGLVPSVAFRLAELWGRSFDEAAVQLSSNAKGYFG